MGKKSVVNEAAEIEMAMVLVRLGARLQVLENETHLSRERLLKLYKEVKGVSPPKGMLPYSTDWFVSWLPNIHASLFLNIYRYLMRNGQLRGVAAVAKGYQLYREQIETNGMDEVLSLTRAWMLVRFCDSKMLQTASCNCCQGEFVVHAYELYDNYVCGLCHPPSRAGKTKKAALEELACA